jgi:pSer/pThr/pTyr-binding forkhead associated (FHA) protein
MPDPDADARARREPLQPRRLVRLDVAGGPSLRLALDRPVLLGRSRRCDVVLSGDPLVSGKHARLSLRAGDVLLEDLVSSNGTRLNGRPLRGPQRVAHGDLITLGRTSIRIHA